jgi:polyhydroxyalkanoate synthesis repressor PhaR
MSQERLIKKYANRRLYDASQSRHITLDDIRALIVKGEKIKVVEDKTGHEITRQILLQVIAEQEHAGEPLMSQDFLSQVIRSYGGAMQSYVGAYLEQSLKLLSSQQQQIREHMRGAMGADAYDSIASLTQKNLERWRTVQEDIFKAMGGSASASSHSPDADDEPEDETEKRV